MRSHYEGDRDWLSDILNAIDRILARTSAGWASFDTDEMLQVWVLYHLQILGEAARRLSAEFRAHPDNVWGQAVGLRNILAHHYFEIDKREIWRVVEHDLGSLRAKVAGLLSQS